jgi:hypothetical protein
VRGPLKEVELNFGGGDGIRTHCLYIANVALYQLSYTPEEVCILAQRAMTLRLAVPRRNKVWLVDVGVQLVFKVAV